MSSKDRASYDLTEKASQHSDEQSTSLARQLEPDDTKEENAPGNTVSPDGDDAGENRVITSISED